MQTLVLCLVKDKTFIRPYQFDVLFLGVATVYARAAHGILQELREFQRSIADKRYIVKYTALLRIQLKELLKKRHTEAFSMKCSPPPSESDFMESYF